MLSATAQREQDILALWEPGRRPRAAPARRCPVRGGAAQRRRTRSAQAMPRCWPCARDCSARRGRCAPPARHLPHRLRVHGGQRSARGRTCTRRLTPCRRVSRTGAASWRCGCRRCPILQAVAATLRFRRRGKPVARALRSVTVAADGCRTSCTRSSRARTLDPGAVLSVRARLPRLRPRLAGRDRHRAGALAEVQASGRAYPARSRRARARIWLERSRGAGIAAHRAAPPTCNLRARHDGPPAKSRAHRPRRSRFAGAARVALPPRFAAPPRNDDAPMH